MRRNVKAEQDHLTELDDLRTRLEEAEDALRAIRNGEVDALVVPRPHGDEIFELKGAEYLYRVFVDTMNEGAATFTSEGTVLYCNHRLAGMLKTSSERVVGSSIYQFIPPAARFGFESAVQKSGREGTKVELVFEREDQELIPVHLSLNAFHGQDFPAICMVAMDLTERKRAEEKISLYQRQLRALASELALAEERERRHLATELHDRIGQNLTLAKIKLSGLLKATSCPGLASPLAEITQMIETTIQDTHSLIFEISPPVLYQVGFEAAVEWLAEHFQEQYGIRIDLKIENKQRTLGGDLRIVLFQAIRELLVNVIKHARASRAKISMKYERNNLHVIVQDDGSGFEPYPDEHQGAIRGFGLFNIRERLHHLGAQIKIESSPGKGTRATLIIPHEIQRETAKKEQDGDKNSTGG
jgi:two-component system, NarL family, sensor histidine kinase UhpB